METELDCLNCGTVTTHKDWTGPTGWRSFRVCWRCGSEGTYNAFSGHWVDFKNSTGVKNA